MKLQAPEGVCSFSHGGVDVEIPANGIVDVSNNPNMVQVMQDHGFTVVREEAPADGKKTRKAAD